MTRVSLADSTGSKTYKRNGVGVTAPVLSDGQAPYSGLGSESRGGVKTYFHSGLKNTDIQTSTTQSVSAQKTYDAFGNVVSASGAWKSPFSYAGKFGYQEDPDSGLKLLGHRYYDSSTGRFLTRDPIKDGRNWYSYCGNNPITGVDPDGRMMQTLVLAAVTGELDPWEPVQEYIDHVNSMRNPEENSLTLEALELFMGIPLDAFAPPHPGDVLEPVAEFPWANRRIHEEYEKHQFEDPTCTGVPGCPCTWYYDPQHHETPISGLGD